MKENKKRGKNHFHSRLRLLFSPGGPGRIKLAALLCVCIFSVLGLSGCGGNSGEQPETAGGDPIAEANIEEADYSSLFHGVNGCAVFYNVNEDKWTFYNKELCEAEASPCSTFKIISTLIGLKYNVVSSADSRMDYDGTQYPREAWNSDLTLKEAFQSSCVWYFRKIIDEVGPEAVEQEVKQLGYGNCDISEWDGTAVNPLPELNGFWLESSLQIAPREMVRVLAELFGGKTDFDQDQLDLVKSLMKQEAAAPSGTALYGKTGSGNRGDAWFAGMAETEAGTTYFAVYLEDEHADGVSGALAKEIASSILDERMK